MGKIKYMDSIKKQKHLNQYKNNKKTCKLNKDVLI